MSESTNALPAYKEGTYAERNTGAACWSCAGLMTHAPGDRCIYPASHRGALTRRQREALADLEKLGHLWPSGSGVFSVSGTGHEPYSHRTVQALVDKRHARWAQHHHGVMPYVEPIRVTQ